MGGGTEWVSGRVQDGLVANFVRNIEPCPQPLHIRPHTAEQPALRFSKKPDFGFLEV